MNSNIPARLAVVGLGVVGLQIARAFARWCQTIGFDIDSQRIRELKEGFNRKGDVPEGALKAPLLTFTDDPAELEKANFVIVTVPTPVDQARRPDLSFLEKASSLIAMSLKNGCEGEREGESPVIIVYESTVYPGCIEEMCIPILEKESGLKVGEDFKVGYSPERINPGDPEHSLENVVKLVSAQDADTLEYIAQVYSLVVKAGVYKVKDIRTAEATKLVENIQRDVNIALMNELAMLFHPMGLNTQEVLKVAKTKWNFLPFEPGLVGGDCLSANSYYLGSKAQKVGYYPDLILTGRRVNESMGPYIAFQAVKLLNQVGKPVRGARALVLGVTFKENVKDTRKSQTLELIRELTESGVDVFVYDPVVGRDELAQLGLNLCLELFEGTQFTSKHKHFQTDSPAYDILIFTVAHQAFKQQPIERYLELLGDGPGVVLDVKGIWPQQPIEKAGHVYWVL